MILGGTLITQNCLTFDYCVGQALESLMAVCDDVVVCDNCSTDGTYEWLHGCMHFSPSYAKLRVYSPKFAVCPTGLPISEMTNYARNALRDSSMHLCLRVDEVIHEEDYSLIRRWVEKGGTYAVNRLSFCGDAQHILVSDNYVVRLAPLSVKSVGDTQGLDPSKGFEKTAIRIFHYGLLTKPKAPISNERLLPHKGSHPAIARNWLKERGYSV